MKFQHFSPQPNCHSVARGALELAVKEGSTTVIALTATPDSLYTGFNAPAVEIPIDQQEVKRYEVKETAEYTNAYSVLDRVEVGSVGLCYFSRINAMKEFCGKAEKMGFSPICVWSINNIDHTMTDEQLEVRRSILEDWVIPPRYDLLIINSSSETSLKIKSPVDYVMVHSSNPDTQIQVRGRVNGDIQTLYLPTEGVPEVKVPDEFLGIRLFTAQKRDLITKLNLRNANNRLRGWPTVKEILIDNDYRITEDRYRSQYYAIITRPSDG